MRRNDSIGYGIPHFERMQRLLTSLPKELLSKTEWLAYPNLASGDCKVIFPSSWQG
ncbi:MAG: hypothetical protein RMJ44_00570 [Cytophagales bacterium]|nr:hypothetical protein [Bernardetiaceae bacterium]MDW8209552.1 hypothetical protein [Cytophagales bacterium]